MWAMTTEYGARDRGNAAVWASALGAAMGDGIVPRVAARRPRTASGAEGATRSRWSAWWRH